MQGQLCRLEPLDAETHGAALHAAFTADTEGRNWTYLPYGPFGSADEYTSWIAEKQVQDDPQFHAILVGDAPVGVASYLRIDHWSGVVEVGHLNYSPALQRTPAATEAMYLMMRRALDELGYRRYEWKCDSFNEPSLAAARRLGFTYEGTFRQAVVTKGRNRDHAWLSILDSEWPAIRAALEAWLDPSNFDDDGRQRRALTDIRQGG
jgi:RimJ/RimL family protein N-acetyltransferase